MDVQMRCPCPMDMDKVRHPKGDTVTLRDSLDQRAVRVIRQAMSTVEAEDPAVQLAERLATCVEFYMLLGVTSWTFLDGGGEPVPVSHAAIRERLFEASDVETVSVAAERQYNPVVLLPLVSEASTFSAPTPTTESTSAKSTPPTPLRPSKQSSTTTTQTAVTGMTSTSLDGVSSSSQKSVTAA